MASTAPASPNAETPECPVCLSPFDATFVVPRVLPCGHSLCGSCISSLPPALGPASAAASLRCPLCSQCVPFPRALGPSSLPKNLALVALLPSLPNSSPGRTTAVATPPIPLPLPLHAAHYPLLARFRHAVLPESASPLHSASPGPTPAGLAIGSLASDLGAPWFCLQGQSVNLLPIEAPVGRSRTQGATFYRLSHVARIVSAIDALPAVVSDQMINLVAASARLSRRVCRVYGVWMDPEVATMWLVSERHMPRVSRLLEERGDDQEMLARIRAVAMEVFEALVGLHSEGLVLGCLHLDCFCLDHFGHCLLDLNELLYLCRGVRTGVSMSVVGVFVAPEIVAILSDATQMKRRDFNGLVGRNSDVWLLGCIFVVLVTGDELLAAGLNKRCHTEESYDVWLHEVLMRLDAELVGTWLEPLAAIILSCLSYNPEGRPEVADIWKCITGSPMKSGADMFTPDDDCATQKNYVCLLLGELSSMYPESGPIESADKVQSSKVSDDKSLTLDDGTNHGCTSHEEVGSAAIGMPQCDTVFKSLTLLSHRDCVTGLAIGGGFLFSSSYDRTINVWSLQDFSHIQSFKGHEHKITAIVVVDNDDRSLCISGDSGSGIFVWHIDTCLKQEPLIKWYEQNDWLYRGVHCLAVSGTGYLYTGSRDKSIKAWSLEDYSLRCTMTGHKSTVSCLAVASGILYSGSWDGTIRSWWLTDHSPLSVLEDNTEGSISPVLSISTEVNFIVSSYENGCLKIWKDNVLVKSEKLQNGSICAVKLNGNCLYAGGWDKVVYIQEFLEDESEVEIIDIASITCDSIVTSLLHWDERLMVGLSNREIKSPILLPQSSAAFEF